MVEDRRHQLEQILSQRQFQIYYEVRENPIQALWERFIFWLADLFHIPIAAGSINALSYMVMSILILITLGAILFLIWKTRKIWSRTSYFEEFTSDSNEIQDYMKEAMKVKQQGDLRLAFRYSFLALLQHLHELNAIQPKPWKTNWDYGREVAKFEPEWNQAFTALASQFDRVWYGKGFVDEQSLTIYMNTIRTWIERKEESDETVST